MNTDPSCPPKKPLPSIAMGPFPNAGSLDKNE
jgi:hypothetical protein